MLLSMLDKHFPEKESGREVKRKYKRRMKKSSEERKGQERNVGEEIDVMCLDNVRCSPDSLDTSHMTSQKPVEPCFMNLSLRFSSGTKSTIQYYRSKHPFESVFSLTKRK